MDIQQLTYSEVIENFAQIAIDYNLRSFKGMSIDDIVPELEAWTKTVKFGKDYVFTWTPENYFKHAFEKIERFPIPIVTEYVVAKTTPLAKDMDTATVAFLKAMVPYFLRFQMHDSIEPRLLNEETNYFTKKFEAKKSIFKGPFEKTASTFFGGKTFTMSEIDFPTEHNVLLAYTKQGILMSALRYQGRTMMNASIADKK